jgi:hypothetical protein
MVRVLSSGAATRGGVTLLLLGGLLAAVLAVTFPFGGCTDVGVDEGTETRFEFRGIEDGNIVYSPDGVNECVFPASVAAVPLAGLLGGLALVSYGRIGGAG